GVRPGRNSLHGLLNDESAGARTTLGASGGLIRLDQGTTVEPMVGMNWHCLSLVLTCPKTVDMMLPDPVSTVAVSVVGPCGLMSGRGLSVALPDLPVVRFTQVT